MAIKKAQKQEKETNNTIEVLKAREIKDRKDCYRFSMRVNGVTIYGCQYITYTDRDGNEKNFVSMPQYKGSDDKCYNHCWVELSDKDVATIEQGIGEKLS